MGKRIDNYAQARECMTKMESQLTKTRRMVEIIKQYQDDGNQGVSKKLTQEEREKYPYS
jgi:hypothetical protein